MIFDYKGVRPNIGEGVFIAPNAVVLGRVTVGSGSSIWFGVVLRGDLGEIRIGEGTSIQDNVVVHAPGGGRTVIGNNVTLGHGCILEGCVIEDRVVIGMNAVVLHDASIGVGSMIAAGSVVGEKTQVPSGYLAAGAPAQVKKALSGSAQAWIKRSAATYRKLAVEYLAGNMRPLDA